MRDSSLKLDVRDFYALESARIRKAFEASGDGPAAVADRSAMVDRLVKDLYRTTISAHRAPPEKLCLVALGGYGRQELFPYSDIDLLFLSDRNVTIERHRKAIAEFTRSLWDAGLRAAQTCHTLDECSSIFHDNLEFNVALIDQRYLAGSEELFWQLRNTNLPRLMAREGQTLVMDLIKLTRERHLKYQDTLFHLEPNLKEAPGGLRDLHVAQWLAVISELESKRRWTRVDELWPPRYLNSSKQAWRFLSAVRCFLHYHQERDDNRLTYELQEKAAGAGVGVNIGQMVPVADWMRTYFRHAREVDRLAGEVIDETQPSRLALYSLYQDWRSRVSNIDFSVVRGKVYLRLPAGARDLAYLLRLFEFVARHGLELSRDAERGVKEAILGISNDIGQYPNFWPEFCRILALPHASLALRSIHRLGWLDLLFPEFRVIDSLVIRDFYHRYVVDEHSLMTIQNLYALRQSEGEWDVKYREILSELGQPQLLVFALLFHDVGKGMATESHVQGSLAAVEQIFNRLSAKPAEEETVRFLIRNHLEMSKAFLHRDIFDPTTVHRMADLVGSMDRLRMLCLMTYCDIKSVNPEALTPWKAEMLWRLYVSTSNALARSLDSERIGGEQSVPASGGSAPSLDGTKVIPEELSKFLEGFPKRYLRTHTYEEIAHHRRMAAELPQNPIRAVLQDRGHYWELTVMTHDRPFLFASLTGTLTAWGMNIIAAEAFANRSGVILDTIRFVDLFHTLVLNPPEQDRLRKVIIDVLTGVQSLSELLRGRMRSGDTARPKLKVSTEIRFDDDSSSHCTLLELVAQDRPGLLYRVSALLSELGCNIEVALIETQGEKAIDVFYLQNEKHKLDEDLKETIQEALHSALGEESPIVN